LPDLEGRRRLVSLYSQGLDLRASNLADVLERTEGTSPAFIRELLRRASLLAIERGGTEPGTLTVRDDDLSAAADELLADNSRLTARLLGHQGAD
jgi:ATP-dependent 26S proteasome regulatory subunit